MSNVNAKAEQFRAMHVRGQPVVLFNIWDAGSARAVDAAGARALATGSWAVATAHGYDDGEGLPLDLAIDNLARIVRVTKLPVTIDLESGYGDAAENVARAVERSIEAGAVGCNLEDSQPVGRALRAVAEQAERYKRARSAADDAQTPTYFINARCDVFMNAPANTHDESMLAEVLERAKAYADAGADGLFAPGLVDAKLIGRLAERSPLPLNVMVADATPPLRELASLGVARVSHGGRPYAFAMKALQDAARAAGLQPA
jgi:2-methylisocitrate lyase-like PEP mutase family enzyme